MNKQIETIEELLLNSIPSIKTLIFAGWVLRLNAGYTYRANCICPLQYESEEEFTKKLKECEGIFEANGIPPIVKVTELMPNELRAILANSGYVKIKMVNVMCMRLADVKISSDKKLETIEKVDEEWLEASTRLTGVRGKKLQAVHRLGIRNIADKSIFVKAKKDNKVIGCAYGTLERGYVGIYDLHVDEKYQSKGLGTAIFNEIVKWAHDNNADYLYLIVHSKNVKAINLYEKMGFAKIYSYDFYKKGTSLYKVIDG
jgi:N-acetylglutamate synthase